VSQLIRSLVAVHDGHLHIHQDDCRRKPFRRIALKVSEILECLTAIVSRRYIIEPEFTYRFDGDAAVYGARRV
jgi:hypothetical protein